MDDLNNISNTLFIPLIARIFCSEKYPYILKDEKAISLKDKLPSDTFNKSKQSQFEIISSASRSAQFDKCINEFIQYNKEAIVVELGCGLETTYYRLHKKPFKYYGLDLKSAIDFRKKIIGKEPFELISNSMLDENWFDKIRGIVKYRPILFIASGLFLYFKEEQIINLLKKIQEKFSHPYILFDALNEKGIKNISRYMKQMGHDDVSSYFYINNTHEFINKIGNKTTLIEEKLMYNEIPRKRLNLMTRASMCIYDLSKMHKVIYLKLK